MVSVETRLGWHSLPHDGDLTKSGEQTQTPNQQGQ